MAENILLQSKSNEVVALRSICLLILFFILFSQVVVATEEWQSNDYTTEIEVTSTGTSSAWESKTYSTEIHVANWGNYSGWWNFTYSNTTIAISNPYPPNGSTGIEFQPTCHIQVNNSNGSTMTIYWYENSTGSWVLRQTNSSVSNGTYYWTFAQADDYQTEYWWKVAVNDSVNNETAIYHFTTRKQYIPDPPSSFTATAASPSQIDLSWDKGINNVTTTYIERNTVASWSRGAGTEIYNSTGTSYSDTGLNAGTTYYYQAWSYNATDNVYSSTYASANATTISGATVITNESTGVEETNATLHGYLQDDGGETCQVGFEWGTTTSYDYSSTFGYADSGDEFSYDTDNLSPLSAGTLYHYRAYAINSNGTAHGSDKTFLTKPYEPTSLTATSDSDSSISLSWTKGDGADKTVIVRKTEDYPANVTDGTVIYNDTGTSYTDSGLSAGTKYYYRAWSYVEDSGLHQYSDLNASVSNFTYPGNVTGISGSATGHTISLSWTKGAGSNNTVIRYSTSSYPTSLTEGTLAYNDTGTSTTVTGLDTNTTYYFSFWSYDAESGYYSQNYTTYNKTTPDVPPSPSNLVATTHNHTAINLSWSASTSVNSVLVRKTGSYPANQSDGTIVFNNTGTSYQDTGLTPSTHYYYRLWTYNGLWSENYTEANNWTLPEPPQNVNYSLDVNGTTGNLTINWTKGSGADRTVIARSSSSYPTSPTSGVIYNDTGKNYTDSNINQPYYYTLWSYNSTSGVYSDPVYLQWFAIWLNCYDEYDGDAISNWSVFISNEDGTQSYTATNCTNSLILNTSLCPQGENIAFKFTASGYKMRVYYVDIDADTLFVLNAYLPPTETPPYPPGGGGGGGTGTNETNVTTQLYLITVIDVYDSPIEDVKMTFMHYNPATESYVNVSILYTDANGQVEIYLIPGDLYKVKLEKDGYQTKIEDYIPSLEIYIHTFRLYFESTTPSPPVNETLWDNITVSIYPSQVYWNTSITMGMNISSADGKLEWFAIDVYKYNNLTGQWVLLHSDNETTSTGGNLSYTTSNETGKYKMIWRFKKQNFSEYSSERIYYIYIKKIQVEEEFPPEVWMLITIFFALAATGFLIKFGAGDLSGLAGIVVMGIMFGIYPVTIAGVSCWLILFATVLGYGIAMFLVRSRV